MNSLSAYLYTLTEDEIYYTSANTTAQFIRAHLYSPGATSVLNEMNVTDCHSDVVRSPNTRLYLEAFAILGNKTQNMIVMELSVFYPQKCEITYC